MGNGGGKRGVELAAFGLAIMLVVLVELLGHRSTGAMAETAGWVNHTHHVLEELDALLIANLDAETGRRGYALTGNDELLVPYRDAATRATKHLAELKRLTTNDEPQHERLRLVEARVTARLRTLDEAIAAQQAAGFDASRTGADTLRGSDEMKAVRSGIAEMSAVERRLLAEREERTRESTVWSRYVQLAGSALGLSMLVLVVIRMRREVLKRRESEAQTREGARELHRANAFLDSIFDNIPHMIFVKDAKRLAFVRFNRAGEQLLGAKREDLIGKSDTDFFPPEEAKAFVDKDRETLEGREVLDIPEEPLTTPAGIRWLHTKKVPIVDENGEPEYLLGISEDITERRNAESMLRASMDATHVAHRELESFSYSVAHDLRAPLRSIDGFSQVLTDDYADKLDDEGKDYLARIRNSARRMAELIDDLLALARVSRSDLTRKKIDVTAIAREVGEQAKKDQKTEAKLVVADGITTHADPQLVRVLLENLMSNAFKFSSRREDACVEVGTRTDEGVDVLYVKDNGAGFDVSSAKRLFTAFQRYHRPAEYEGTGIGLATAERIVSRHGGKIWAESAPDAGATFHFTLK